VNTAIASIFTTLPQNNTQANTNAEKHKVYAWETRRKTVKKRRKPKW